MSTGWDHVVKAAHPLDPLEFQAYLDFVRAAPADLPLPDLIARAARHLATLFPRPHGQQRSTDVLLAIHGALRLSAPALLLRPPLPATLSLVAVPKVQLCLHCSGLLETLPTSHSPFFYRRADEQGAQGTLYKKLCR